MSRRCRPHPHGICSKWQSLGSNPGSQPLGCQSRPIPWDAHMFRAQWGPGGAQVSRRADSGATPCHCPSCNIPELLLWEGSSPNRLRAPVLSAPRPKVLEQFLPLMAFSTEQEEGGGQGKTTGLLPTSTSLKGGL